MPRSVVSTAGLDEGAGADAGAAVGGAGRVISAAFAALAAFAASTALTALLDSHVHYRGTVCRTGGLRCGTAASELRKEDPMMSNGVMREMSSCCQSCQCCECR